GVRDGSRLETAVDHAIGAFLIGSSSVPFPGGLLHQLLERLGITLTKQVTGPLPTEHRSRRIAPRGARVALIARKEIQEQRRLKKWPRCRFRRMAEDVPKQLLGPCAVEKVLLVGSTLVGIPWRDRDAIDTQRLHIVEEPGNAIRLSIVEKRAIDVDAEAFCLRVLDRYDGLVVDALLANRPVVHLPVTVEMHRPIEASVRSILPKLLVHQQRVGANRDELTFCERTRDDLRQLLVQ